MINKNKNILVVGGFGLLGRTVVKKLISKDFNVIIGDIKDEKDKYFYDLTTNSLIYSNLDIINPETIDQTILLSKQKYGSLDACINLSYPRSSDWGKNIENITIEYLTENLKLQLGGPIILSQRILKFFIKQGYGNFIHCSSIQGISTPKFEHYVGTNMNSPIEYSAVKSGIISATKWLSKYYKNKNIRINSISPGGILDGQDKKFLKKYRDSCNSKGMLETDDIVGTLIFLLSDDSKYINGQNIIIDDGWSL